MAFACRYKMAKMVLKLQCNLARKNNRQGKYYPARIVFCVHKIHSHPSPLGNVILGGDKKW